VAPDAAPTDQQPDTQGQGIEGRLDDLADQLPGDVDGRLVGAGLAAVALAVAAGGG